MLFIEILLSIHCLLLISSWFIGGRRLADQPSFKLKLARLLFVSCVISPLLVHCLNPTQKPERLRYISLDGVQEYAKQPILNTKSLGYTHKSVPAFIVSSVSYCQLFYVIFCLLILTRVYLVLLNLNNLRSILRESIPYRTSGKLVIKVSDRCHIPFSVSFLNNAYIVLPVSLLSSSKNVKIAIAHEGQHHRNRDCLWAYFIEVIRIIFFANPGVTKWCRVLSELQELSCDEILIAQTNILAHDYGHCLFKVVQTASKYTVSSSYSFGCMVGMASSKANADRTFIIRRISMLSNYPSKASKPWLLGIALAALSILAPICIAYSASGSLISPKVTAVDLSHLDSKLQKIATDEIATAVKQYHAKSGVITIVDPTTGNIIALAEAGKNNEQSSWMSRIFSPGSTISLLLLQPQSMLE